MKKHPVESQIEKADKAIVAKDFDTLKGIYTEDAILVVEPGRVVQGRDAISKAFEAISQYFKNGLQVKQNGMTILEAGDTVLVHANTIISAPNLPETERKAAYVFTKTPDGVWLCSIDNSYGNEIVKKRTTAP
ncbi:SgcJ/EcaC family oxidoreductase [Desulfovibrio sp. Huiquan2017]|uniref:YybH family protein n=1 Tax=Desulfovibrio sp. Huiquan2017 TaxID=2816861 RepID=UPI001A90E21C|nr:SgcJ/EcaC family oxidoreductase [Desulfovibrio sp. Huiquan2017]